MQSSLRWVVQGLGAGAAILTACATLPTFFNTTGPAGDAGGDVGGEAKDAFPDDGGVPSCVSNIRSQGTATCGSAPTGALAVARGPLSSSLLAASKSDLFYILGRSLIRKPLAAFSALTPAQDAGSDSGAGVANAGPAIELSLDACPLDVSYTFKDDELAHLTKLLPFGDAGVCLVFDTAAPAFDAGTEAGSSHVQSVLCSRDGQTDYLALSDAIAKSSDPAVKRSGPIRLADGNGGNIYWVSELSQGYAGPHADAVFRWDPASVPALQVTIGESPVEKTCHGMPPSCTDGVFDTTENKTCQHFPSFSTHFSAGNGAFETLSSETPPTVPALTAQKPRPCNVPTWTAKDGSSAGIQDGFSTAIRTNGLLAFDKVSGSSSLRITTAGDAVLRGIAIPAGQPTPCSTAECFYGYFIPGSIPLTAVDLKGRHVVAAASAGTPATRLLAIATEGAFAGDYDLRIASAYDGALAPLWADNLGPSAAPRKIQGDGAMSIIGVGNEFFIAVKAATGPSCNASDGFIARVAP